MRKVIINAVCKKSAKFGHDGYYHCGEYMNRVINYFLVTTEGKIFIDPLKLKTAANLNKMPTEAVLNKKLAGKVISKGRDIAKQLAKFL